MLYHDVMAPMQPGVLNVTSWGHSGTNATEISDQVSRPISAQQEFWMLCHDVIMALMRQSSEKVMPANQCSVLNVMLWCHNGTNATKSSERYDLRIALMQPWVTNVMSWCHNGTNATETYWTSNASHSLLAVMLTNPCSAGILNVVL